MTDKHIKIHFYIDENDTRMHRLVFLCSSWYFKAKSTTKHFLNEFRVRRDKRVQTISINRRKGEPTLITYNLDWLKKAKTKVGTLNHAAHIDTIYQSIEKADNLKTRKKRR